MWARFPWTIACCAALLMLLGLSGIQRADELSRGLDLFDRQVTWLLLALPVMIATLCVPYRRLKPFSYPLFLSTLPWLVVVFYMPARNGARSWIPLGFFDFQPSELAKLSFILALAHYLMYRENYRTLRGLVPPFLVMLIPMGLILKEPDLGSAILFVPVLFAMLFAAGARPRHLLLIVGLAVACSPVFWKAMNAEQRSRVTTFFSQTDGGPAPRGDGYHQHQSKQVLSLGGMWGSELQGQLVDDTAAYHLPAGQTDFVFCLVGERWGLLGTWLTLALYGLLFARGLSIAGGTQEPFGRLVAVGIVAQLATQTIINTGMTVGLMPITGITLPLMSYGGSSLLTTSVELGLLMNIGLRPGYELTGEPFRFLPKAAPLG